MIRSLRTIGSIRNVLASMESYGKGAYRVIRQAAILVREGEVTSTLKGVAAIVIENRVMPFLLNTESKMPTVDQTANLGKQQIGAYLNGLRGKPTSGQIQEKILAAREYLSDSQKLRLARIIEQAYANDPLSAPSKVLEALRVMDIEFLTTTIVNGQLFVLSRNIGVSGGFWRIVDARAIESRETPALLYELTVYSIVSGITKGIKVVKYADWFSNWSGSTTTGRILATPETLKATILEDLVDSSGRAPAALSDIKFIRSKEKNLAAEHDPQKDLYYCEVEQVLSGEKHTVGDSSLSDRAIVGLVFD